MTNLHTYPVLAPLKILKIMIQVCRNRVLEGCFRLNGQPNIKYSECWWDPCKCLLLACPHNLSKKCVDTRNTVPTGQTSRFLQPYNDLITHFHRKISITVLRGDTESLHNQAVNASSLHQYIRHPWHNHIQRQILNLSTACAKIDM